MQDADFEWDDDKAERNRNDNEVSFEEARGVYRLENMWPQVVPVPEEKVPTLFLAPKKTKKAVAKKTVRVKKAVTRKAAR